MKTSVKLSKDDEGYMDTGSMTGSMQSFKCIQGGGGVYEGRRMDGCRRKRRRK